MEFSSGHVQGICGYGMGEREAILVRIYEIEYRVDSMLNNKNNKHMDLLKCKQILIIQSIKFDQNPYGP